MVILTILNLLVRRSFSVGRNRIFALLITVCLILNLNLKSQVAVNTNGADANSSAMLDVSSTEKGILIPRMTLSQRNDISNPVTGLMIYQTNNTPGFYFYNGSSWVVVGDGATSINSLYDGVSDGSSIFLGNGSGVSDDGTSNQNLGYGISALNANTNGYENTAIGIEALKLTTEGHHNTALGIHSLSAITTGSNNTALGTNTGISNTGSGNIFIGANAAYNELGSNKLYIENSASSTPLIYGDFSSDLLRVNGTLDINNAYQLPTSDGTSGQTLKTDGSGSLTWSDDTNTGATSINELSDAATDNNSLFLGVDAGPNDDGTTNFNTGTGVWSLKEVTSGSHNSAMGTTTLQNLTTGSQNTGFGMGALNSVTTNSNNTAIGKEAGKDVTGSGNVFIGNEAAKTQTSISNKLFLDNSDNSAPLIYGEFDNNKVRINGTFEILSTIKIEGGSPGSGKVLNSDAVGNATWATLSNSSVGLGNVENTALSTWAGTTNITTLGTIGVGIWNGTSINATYIGSLPTSKITSGTFDNARINWAVPGAIGATTPTTAKFTTLFTSGTTTLGDASADAITVKGALKIESGTPGANKVLTSDASGNASWETSASGGVASDESGLKIIRGTINADGTIITGSGFSVNRTDLGEYTITFTSAFSGAPTVTTSVIFSDDTASKSIGIYVNSSSTTNCVIETFDSVNGGDDEGTGFTFIAIGPQ